MNQKGVRWYHMGNFRYILTLFLNMQKKTMKNGNFP